jgi:N-acetylneuraminic acid mutarotase
VANASAAGRAGRAARWMLVLAIAGSAATSWADEVVGFTLVDAGSDTDIGPLGDGAVLDVDVLGTTQLAVRADTAPASVGSVVFDLDGNDGFRTESAAPYALFGDNAGNYAPWSGVPLLGVHTLTATAYTGSGGGGTPGTPLSISFEVVDPPPPPGGAGAFGWETYKDSPGPHYEAQGIAVGGRLFVFGGFNVGAVVTPASYAFDLASDTWTTLTPMPEALTHAGQAADGTFVYIAGGFVGSSPGGSTEHVWVYDTEADSWSAGPDLPADRGGGGLARVGRTLHYFGGGTRTQGSNPITDMGDHWSLDLGGQAGPGDDAASWTPLAPLPNPRNHLGGTAAGGLVYAIGGQHGTDEFSGNQDDVHVYDPVGGSWAPVADMPRPLSHMSASNFPMNGRVVVAAGVTQGGGDVADVIEYDPASDTWVALPSLPGSRQSPVAGFVDGRIVVNGGDSGVIHRQTWVGQLHGSWESTASLPVAMGEVAGGVLGGTLYLVGEGSTATLAYDLATGTWAAVGSLAARPYPGDHHAAAVVDGKLYLIGGLGDGSEGRVQIYDPLADAWSEGALAPVLSGAGSAALIDGLIFYAGGIVGSSTTDAVAVYDPVADSWTSPLAPMPVGVNHAAHATDGERLFVFGGRSGGNSPQNGFDFVQIYDPVSDTWEASNDPGSTLAPLPQARGGTGQAVYLDGEFHVFGGETLNGVGATPDGVYDRVDVYDPLTNSWREGDPMPTARHGIWPILHAGRIYLAGGGTEKGYSQSLLLEVYNAPISASAAPAVPALGAWGGALRGAVTLLVLGTALHRARRRPAGARIA